jgi:DNA-binding beta-propeller fold protein YncE
VTHVVRTAFIATLLLIFSLPVIPHSPAWALQVTGLKNPAAFVVDAATGAYYLSNENGGPSERDNNGFITMLDRDGKILKLKFIEGGIDGVTLHAPKGLAIVKKTLYAADIDKVRGFDLVSGRPTQDVDLSTFKVDFLTGMVADSNGLLFIADSGTDTIYRVDTQRFAKPTVWVKDAILAGPHGLALHPTTGALIVVSWNTGKILEVDKSGVVKVLFSNSLFNSRFGNLMGVDFDAYGNMYVSDYSQGKVLRIDPGFRIQTIAEFLTTPAGLAVDRKNNLILVPYLAGNVAEINGLGRDKR